MWHEEASVASNSLSFVALLEAKPIKYFLPFLLSLCSGVFAYAFFATNKLVDLRATYRLRRILPNQVSPLSASSRPPAMTR